MGEVLLPPRLVIALRRDQDQVFFENLEVYMEEKEIGTITHYFSNINVGIIQLSDALKIGDTIHIKGHASDFTQKVDSLQIEHVTVTEAKSGDAVGTKVSQKIHIKDKVFKVIS